MDFYTLLRFCTAFEDLLTRERSAILAARFAEMAGFAAEKQRLAEVVARSELDTRRLGRLNDQLQRNGTLMSSMRKGVIAARDRINAMKDHSTRLETYDASGRKLVLQGSGECTGQRV